MGGIMSRSILYEELLEITTSIFKLNRRLRIAEQLTVGYGGGGIVGTEIGHPHRVGNERDLVDVKRVSPIGRSGMREQADV